MRFVGSWSVRLASSGRHSNHIHPKGWASSAFYVALPGSVLESDSASRAGWIQFGRPLEDLGLDLPPRRVIQPRPGHLALFPSCMWHGTVPFEAPEPRLTMAFDMQPRG
ncbi:putative 2OG-Fe(II) oxygenase [Luteimonas marina]|uniref:putative 2OG-Fe(II) oxygenase n=1 Tax=Luteimonas marina TaxID=488485 RepID=UPI0013159D83|nr:putative 2OG-Fe(II) oxygenase [Luteimonas marina]